VLETGAEILAVVVLCCDRGFEPGRDRDGSRSSALGHVGRELDHGFARIVPDEMGPFQGSCFLEAEPGLQHEHERQRERVAGFLDGRDEIWQV